MVRNESESGFSMLHPAVSFLYFVVVITACLLFKHPLYLYTLFMVAILLNWTIDGGKALYLSMKSYVLMVLIIALANPLFSSRGATILFYLFDRPVTLEAIVYGVQFGFSLFSILVLFVAYNLIVTYDKFLYLFGSIAPRTSFVVIVTIRFIPLLKRRLQDIMAIQKVQGAFQEGGKKKRRMKEGMATLHTLVTWSLEEALMTASSMRARGYGVSKRSSAIRYSWDGRDVTILSIMAIAGTLLFIGAFGGMGQYEVYPQLQEIPFSARMLFHYSSFLIFLLIPIIVNGKVWLEWRFIRSKM